MNGDRLCAVSFYSALVELLEIICIPSSALATLLQSDYSSLVLDLLIFNNYFPYCECHYSVSYTDAIMHMYLMVFCFVDYEFRNTWDLSMSKLCSLWSYDRVLIVGMLVIQLYFR